VKTNTQIQQDVHRELKWDPRVDEPDVGVEVDGGVVTLTRTHKHLDVVPRPMLPDPESPQSLADKVATLRRSASPTLPSTTTASCGLSRWSGSPVLWERLAEDGSFRGGQACDSAIE
jgi:hypothetical protein